MFFAILQAHFQIYFSEWQTADYGCEPQASFDCDCRLLFSRAGLLSRPGGRIQKTQTGVVHRSPDNYSERPASHEVLDLRRPFGGRFPLLSHPGPKVAS